MDDERRARRAGGAVLVVGHWPRLRIAGPAMSEHTPVVATEVIRQTFAYIQAGLDDDDGYPFVMHVHVESFDRWLAEVERAAAEKAWDEAKAEVRGIPHWFDPVRAYGEFDIQPLGPHRTSEQGAFMEVMEVLSENPYRRKAES